MAVTSLPFPSLHINPSSNEVPTAYLFISGVFVLSPRTLGYEVHVHRFVLYRIVLVTREGLIFLFLAGMGFGLLGGRMGGADGRGIAGFGALPLGLGMDRYERVFLGVPGVC